MVKVNPNKEDLVPGYSGPPAIFRKMGLSVGDTFTNKNGTKVLVERASLSDKLYIQRLEDTKLENITESILTDIGLESSHFEKQYHPEKTNYRIDFAIPSIRLAIEPHASYLWDVNEGQEHTKEANLNDLGWNVLWLDETDLEDQTQAEETIRESIINALERIEVDIDNRPITIRKTVAEETNPVTYELQEDNNDTVVYQGKVVPTVIAELESLTSSPA